MIAIQKEPFIIIMLKMCEGKKHNSHQKLYRLDASSPHEHPKHKSLKESYQDTKPKEIQVSVKREMPIQAQL